MPDADPKSSFSPFEVRSPPRRCYANVDDQSIDEGSSCSSGSIKISRLSSLDFPSDSTPFRPNVSRCEAFLSSQSGNVKTAALREDTSLAELASPCDCVLEEDLEVFNPGGLVHPQASELDSVNLKKELSLETSPHSGGSALVQSSKGIDDNGKITLDGLECSDAGYVSLMEEKSLQGIPKYDGSVLDDCLRELDIVTRPADLKRRDSQAPVVTARPAPPTEATQITGLTPLIGLPVTRCRTARTRSYHEVETWDSAVTVSTTASIFKGGKAIVHHHVDMTVVVPKVHISTGRVKLSIMVSNGLRKSHTREVLPGLSSLSFEEEGLVQESLHEEHEIVVFRDACDLEVPIALYFSFAYPPQPLHSFITIVPTFRPNQGTALSERVFINQPSTPLIIKPLARNYLSSWKAMSNSTSQVTQFERVRMPRCYPENFRDDIHLRIMDPGPVLFESLHDLDPSDVVWNLDMLVEEAIGGKIECDLSFNVEVGVSNPVVVLNARGWRPKYFAIDGRLTTEQVGTWRMNEEGHVALYKEPSMKHGPARIETHWEEPKDRAHVHGDESADVPLPILMDLRVVGGKLACRLSEMRVAVGYSQLDGKGPPSFGRSGETSSFYTLGDGPYVRLPDMYPGHKLWLVPDSDGLDLPLPTLLEDIEPFDYPSRKVRIDCDIDHEEHCESPPINHAGQNSPDEFPSISRLLLRLLSFLLPLCLTLGLLLLVLGQYHWIRLGWRDSSKTKCTLDGHCGLQDVTKIPQRYELANSAETTIPIEVNEAVVAYSSSEATHVQDKDEAKGLGLYSVRDWIDHALGWQEWHGYA